MGKTGKRTNDKDKTESPAKKAKTDVAPVDEKPGIPTKDGCNFTIASWNVAGLRAWVKKNGVEFVKQYSPDVVCLQETKCGKAKLPPEVEGLEGYEMLWLSGLKEGYAGVSVWSKKKPLKVEYGIGEPKFDGDGRVITVEYDNFYVVNVYVPNSGRGLVNLGPRQEWDVLFRNYLVDLDSKKPVIIAGDMNVSHLEIDLANPKSNKKNAGFTKEERDGFSALLEAGFADTFREFYPGKTGAYTFWTYMGNARGKNVGWRLDYFLVSKRFMDSVCDNKILAEVLGSDHCPIMLEIKV